MTETPSRDDRPGAPSPEPSAPAEEDAPSSRRAAREALRQSPGTAPDPAVDAASVAPSQPAAAERTVTSSTAPLEALFEDEGLKAPSASASPPDRDRRKSRIAAWSVFAIVIAIIGGLVGGGFVVFHTYEDQIRKVMGWEEPKDYEAGIAEGEASVTVLSGQTGADISRALFDAGVTKTTDAFYSYLIASGEDPNVLKPGVYSLQKKMTSKAVFAALLDPANK